MLFVEGEILYKIRLSKSIDKKRIIDFIFNNWSKNHIFVKDNSFFEYEFEFKQVINFVIAENSQEDIMGILGFIQYSEYFTNSDIFTVMWMVSDKSKDLTLGLKLYYFLLSLKPKSISSVGVNDKTLKFYDYLGFKTGKLKHYYYLNNVLENYHISKINKISKTLNENADLTRIKLIEFKGKNVFDKKYFLHLINYNNISKSINYLKKRYLRHPYYNYKFFHLIESNSVKAMMVAREQKYLNYKVLRIIDYFGPSKALGYIRDEFKKIMFINNYEYIDFYQFGLNEEDLQQAGFIENDFANIIPNYFEPYILENIEINYITNVKNGSIYLFKGDGDQDRPNQVMEKKI